MQLAERAAVAEQTQLLAFDRQNHMGASDTSAASLTAAIREEAEALLADKRVVQVGRSAAWYEHAADEGAAQRSTECGGRIAFWLPITASEAQRLVFGKMTCLLAAMRSARGTAAGWYEGGVGYSQRPGLTRPPAAILRLKGPRHSELCYLGTWHLQEMKAFWLLSKTPQAQGLVYKPDMDTRCPARGARVRFNDLIILRF